MTVRAFSAGWITSLSRLLRRDGGLGLARLSMTCLLVERPEGLLLVDTGFAVSARENPRANVGTLFQLMSPISLPVGDAAVERVRAIGRRPEDVTDVVLTHLDVDHAAGLEDFPKARVHVARAELEDALGSWNPRYRHACWAHGARWEKHDLLRQETLGFPTSRDIFGDGSVVLLGAAGHSKGHVAVAVRCGARHVVHTGDAVYLEDEARLGVDGLGPGLRTLRRLVDRDKDEAERTRRLVGSLMANEDATVVTAHDERGLARLAPFPYPIG
ncbi:MAG TPA: MBL fold metallo-hydrolase [Planctomycetota bacterium]|nr:MBL fold metallo-hydrolase [Planctomycetota bacterium]